MWRHAGYRQFIARFWFLGTPGKVPDLYHISSEFLLRQLITLQKKTTEKYLPPTFPTIAEASEGGYIPAHRDFREKYFQGFNNGRNDHLSTWLDLLAHSQLWKPLKRAHDWYSSNQANQLLLSVRGALKPQTCIKMARNSQPQGFFSLCIEYFYFDKASMYLGLHMIFLFYVWSIIDLLFKWYPLVLSLHVFSGKFQVLRQFFRLLLLELVGCYKAQSWSLIKYHDRFINHSCGHFPRSSSGTNGPAL